MKKELQRESWWPPRTSPSTMWTTSSWEWWPNPSLRNFDAIGFPLVEVNNFTVDIYPKEDDETNHGIGILPYILSRGDSDLNVMPTSTDIKTATCDLLASSTMPTAKKSTKRWNDSIAKNDWTARESSKEWPSPLDSEDEVTVEDISGREIEYK